MAHYAIFFSPTGGTRKLSPPVLALGKRGMKKVCGGHKENKFYL